MEEENLQLLRLHRRHEHRRGTGARDVCAGVVGLLHEEWASDVRQVFHPRNAA
jgi:hypothetical protein